MKKLLVAGVAMIMGIGSFVSLGHAQNGGGNVFDGSRGTGVEGVATPGTENFQQDSFVNIVKGAINWMLGILALIALIVLLYGGFRMVTAAGNEEQYNSGFTILKQAAVGLGMIGIAWFIVSIIFFLISTFTSNATPAGTGGI